ncbi:MAG: hypothetical protein BIFFINMI_03563 [Phycisphaerae bacterium]|nr:hypothetical protein [Phycisphaerae bacterium]
MSKKKYQIFVSSTFQDLIGHRQGVSNALLKADHLPVGMETFPADDKDSWEVIKRVIDDSDYYVVIIGGRYGTTDETGMSYTEREYDYAVSKSIPVLAFIHKKPEDIPYKHTEADESKRIKLEAFRKKALQRACRYWQDEKDLMTEVMASLMQVSSMTDRPGWVRGDQVRTGEDARVLSELNQQVASLQRENAALRRQTGKITSPIEQFISGSRQWALQWLTVKPRNQYNSKGIVSLFKEIQDAAIKAATEIDRDEDAALYKDFVSLIDRTADLTEGGVVRRGIGRQLDDAVSARMRMANEIGEEIINDVLHICEYIRVLRDD